MERYIKFETAEGIGWGVFEDGKIVGLSGNPACGFENTGLFYQPSAVKLLAPVEPTKIICVGLNYREHILENQAFDETESQATDGVPEEPILFLKPPSALIGPGERITLPEMAKRVDYEAELGVVIGRECHNVASIEAEDYIFGFTCINDVTARDLQQKDIQWTRAKGFDTFCPVGPWVVDNLKYENLSVEAYLNGERRQSSRISAMIFPIAILISFISKIMTLYPGDLIATGTPAGVGPMQTGDRIEIRIEGIGSLVNDVI
ncbi:MAG: fumarylacetoacetate hydrolase family protein [candidate division Zixibacteria bacterium]|nr:fumarylacetoacetate hydrolase family protein [candidate division Zixibacteria bacterium]